MKASILTRVLGIVLPAALFFVFPVFAHEAHHSGRYVDHNYSFGGHVDHQYGHGWHRDHRYSHGGYADHGYAGAPYYGGYAYGYEHPAGTRGYRGKDARHHRRGHRHHHGR